MAKLPTIEGSKTPLEKLSTLEESTFGMVLGAGIESINAATESKLKDAKKLTAEREAEQKQFTKDAEAAQVNAEYSSALSKGTSDFIAQYDKRVSQVTDENGNPTFGTLPEDTQNIGDEVKQSILDTIPDLKTARRFSDGFDRFVLQKKTQAFNQSRQQQQGFLKAKFAENVDDLINTAVMSDPSSMNFFVSEINDSIVEAVRTGALSPEQGVRFKDESRSRIVVEGMKEEIKNNPEDALKIIDGMSEALLKPDEKRKLLDFADAVKKDNVAEHQKALKAQYNTAQVTVANQFAGLNSAIQSGKAGLADVEEVKSNALEAISSISNPDDLKKLETDILNQSVKSQKAVVSANNKADVRQDTNEDVGNTILSGESLDLFTNKQVDRHYTDTIEALEKAKGEPLGLTEQSAIALKYKGPVKSFQHTLAESILNGDPGDAMQAVQSYNHFDSHNKDGLRQLDKKAEAVASVAGRLSLISGVDPQKAIQLARQRVDTSPTFEAIQTRESDFKKSKFRELDEVRSFAEDTFDTLFTSEPEIGGASLAKLQKVIKDAWIDTGNQDDAVALAEKRVTRNFGVTNINGTNEVVFLPVENFLQGADTESIRGFVKEELGADIGGDVKLISDTLTGKIFDRRGNRVPNYMIVETDPDTGIDVPVFDEDSGQVLRFTLDAETISKFSKRRQESKIEEAGQTREDIASGQERLVRHREARKRVREATNTSGFLKDVRKNRKK